MLNLSLLANLALEEISVTPRRIGPKGMRSLRELKGLKTIGVDWNQMWPAAEFWARYDHGDFK